VLVGDGFRKYGRDSKAIVNFMIKHQDILDGNLQRYYESVGRPGGPTMNKAIDRVRRLQQKKLQEARQVYGIRIFPLMRRVYDAK
jgi:hypothetical protein